jgi:predicted nucleic acid-binding protein
MRRTVLADAGPLYAAADTTDEHHNRAQRELSQLERDDYKVVVAYPTLLESYNLILFRLGNNVALRWLSEMTSVVLVNPTSEDYRQAAARLQAFYDQPITLFDATVAVLAARLDTPVWTYDHHFDMMRTTIWR